MKSAVLTTDNLGIGYAPRPGRLRVQSRAPGDGAAPRHLIAAELNLTLHAGELVCLLGPNGAGKSTLIRTLAGMQPPLAGQVFLAGAALTSLRPRDLARHLSVVLTDRVDVGNLSVYALVALGRHPYTDWMGTLTAGDELVVRRAIAAVGAVELAHRQVHELSDGERQRVMIARALAQEPAVIILDEPTAFLDLPRRVEMMRLLRHLARTTGQAILLSTHDLDLALRSADRLWLMAADGTIHTGAPEDLVLSGAFEAVFRGEGVAFDAHTGTFQIHPQIHGLVAVRGTGLPATWTVRALERAGFRVVAAEEAAPMRVEILSQSGCPGWRGTVQGKTCLFTTIYDLVAWLREAVQTTRDG